MRWHPDPFDKPVFLIPYFSNETAQRCSLPGNITEHVDDDDGDQHGGMVVGLPPLCGRVVHPQPRPGEGSVTRLVSHSSALAWVWAPDL